MLNSNAVASSLAMSAAPKPKGGALLASVLAQVFSEKNKLKGLSLAFP